MCVQKVCVKVHVKVCVKSACISVCKKLWEYRYYDCVVILTMSALCLSALCLSALWEIVIMSIVIMTVVIMDIVIMTLPPYIHLAYRDSKNVSFPGNRTHDLSNRSKCRYL